MIMKQLEFILNKLVDYILESKISILHHSLIHHTVYCHTHMFKSEGTQQMISCQFLIPGLNYILILILVDSLELKLLYLKLVQLKTQNQFLSHGRNMSK